MLEYYSEIMLTLGVIILIILLCIILPGLIIMKHRQNRIIEAIDASLKTIECLNNNNTLMHELITSNFKDVTSKLMIIDSHLVSSKDALKDISQGLGEYHTKTIDAIGGVKNPNKRRKSNSFYKPGGISPKV